jgi:hypothetical protein
MSDQIPASQTRRQFLRFAGGSALALSAVAVTGTASLAKDSRVDRRISLAATSAGRAIDASGYARVRSRSGRETLNVEVEARVKAGTRYTVYVTNGSTIKVGTIRISSIGEGEIELKNYDGQTLPAGVSPVTGIRKVTVKNSAGTTILSGSF